MINTKSLTQDAEQQLTGTQLDALMTGNTVYLREPNGGGDIVLWYGADGKAMARLPSGGLLHGTWAVKGDLSCIKWSYAPNNDSCSKLVRRGGGLVLLENGTDRLLGTVNKIVPKNIENL
ncbi:MAG TPA: hypothetical protein ENH60_04495 [Pricia sp.]|uniref:Uncharacterized protein n=2 Tax=root TaxID=1 RepID=A0A831QPG6_9FLAO|nr:hypothetical protein [Pricia sp.]HEA22509.1 hypothetical protein [Pricia antarctica]